MDKSDDGPGWYWAHVMWQNHGIRMEEWTEMPRNVQLAYIASELVERDTPQKSVNRLAKAFLKSK